MSDCTCDGEPAFEKHRAGCPSTEPTRPTTINLLGELQEQLTNGTANDLAQTVIDNQEEILAALRTSLIAPTAGARCTAETTFRDDEHKTYQCVLPEGHLDSHQSGTMEVEWTDETTKCRDLSRPNDRWMSLVAFHVDEWRGGDSAGHARGHIEEMARARGNAALRDARELLARAASTLGCKSLEDHGCSAPGDIVSDAECIRQAAEGIRRGWEAAVWCLSELQAAEKNASYARETLIENLKDRIQAALRLGPYEPRDDEPERPGEACGDPFDPRTHANETGLVINPRCYHPMSAIGCTICDRAYMRDHGELSVVSQILNDPRGIPDAERLRQIVVALGLSDRWGSMGDVEQRRHRERTEWPR